MNEEQGCVHLIRIVIGSLGGLEAYLQGVNMMKMIAIIDGIYATCYAALRRTQTHAPCSRRRAARSLDAGLR